MTGKWRIVSGLLAAGSLLFLPACTGRPGTGEKPEAPTAEGPNVFPVVTEADAVVSGFLRGTMVRMRNAEFQNQLAIFEGDGWGSSPSLLIFQLLDTGDIPEGRTYRIASNAGSAGGSPHVQYRWRFGDGDAVDTHVVTSGYDMTLVFGKAQDGVLPGTIEFKVPGEDTEVSGSFRAVLK